MSVFHRCPAPGCPKAMPPDILACKPHWFMLPKELRDRIWKYYKRGQDIGSASEEYKAALQDAIAFWSSEFARATKGGL